MTAGRWTGRDRSGAYACRGSLNVMHVNSPDSGVPLLFPPNDIIGHIANIASEAAAIEAQLSTVDTVGELRAVVYNLAAMVAELTGVVAEMHAAGRQHTHELRAAVRGMSEPVR